MVQIQFIGYLLAFIHLQDVFLLNENYIKDSYELTYNYKGSSSTLSLMKYIILQENRCILRKIIGVGIILLLQ